MKRALITGITGQDGSYLAELLLKKDYEVHGIIRRASSFNSARIDHLYQDRHTRGVKLFLHYGDLSDSVSLVKLLYDLKPDEIYHRGRDDPHSGSDPRTRGRPAVLPGFIQRNVRQGGGDSAVRNDPVSSPQPV